MKYEIKTIDDIAIFSLSGKMFGDKLTSNLYDEAKSMIEKGIKDLIIDLRQVDFINSIGLGVVIACRTSSIKAGGCLKLIGKGKNIMKYFQITELDKFFEFYGNEEEALASFTKR
jgi:anti-sigma B factor antagonist